MVILDVLQLDVAWSTTQLIVGNWGLASQGMQLIAEPQNSMERLQKIKLASRSVRICTKFD